MAETSSFTDPVFLARFGLSRANVIDYFLHPMNPFRCAGVCSNEVLGMQGISIYMLMAQGTTGEPLTPKAAEEEYNEALARLTGEQYELLPPNDRTEEAYLQASALFTIRHVVRQRQTSVKVLAVYYVVEGVIYKAPSVRALQKSNIARTLQGLSGACSSLSSCARYQPSVGYAWVFEKDELDPGEHLQLVKRRKRRKILDNRPPGERTPAEEEGIRASEALDAILVRISKSLKNI